MGRLFGLSDNVGTWSSFVGYVDINLNHSGVLTDYQKQLTIPYLSGMQSNFNDIRFSIWNGTAWEYVPQWLESKTDSITADIWIKNDYLSGDTAVRMYYGNTGLSSGSSIGDVFIDGTEFGDLSGWTQQAGSWSVSAGELVVPTTSSAYLKRNVAVTEGSYIIGARFKTTDGRFVYIAESNGTIVLTTSTGLMVHSINDQLYCSDDWSDHNIESLTFNNDIYYKSELQIDSGNNKSTAWSDADSLIGSITQTLDSAGTGNYWGIYGGTGYSARVDYMYVRKYTATEPTYTISTPQHQRREPQYI